MQISPFVVVVLTLIASASSLDRPTLGAQSGPDTDSSFVSSSIYLADDDTILVTGSTYGNFPRRDEAGTLQLPIQNSYRCFLGVLGRSDMQWKSHQLLGNPLTSAQLTAAGRALDSPQSISQSCQSMTMHGDRLFLAGHSGNEKGGVLESLFNRNSVLENVQYGTIMDLRRNQENYQLAGGLVLQQSAAVYPVSIVTTPSDDLLFVASLASDSKKKNADYNLDTPTDPNLLVPIGKPDSLMLDAYQMPSPDVSSPPVKTLSSKYHVYYRPASGDEIHVAGMVRVSGSFLVVAGHTRGQGKGFGQSFDASSLQASSPTMDGFVTKFSTAGLKPITTDDNSLESTLRIQTLDKGEDQIWGICNDEIGDPDHVYIVGSTTGNVNSAGGSSSNRTQAFIMKIQISTMAMVWQEQLGLDQSKDPSPWAQVIGIACVVARDGQHLWWAGHVTNGATVQHQDNDNPQSYGKTDIFVSMLMTENGERVVMQQFGSSEDDALALRGALSTDTNGNVIVVGNTYGSLCRDTSDANVNIADVFVTTVSTAGRVGTSTQTVPVVNPVSPTPAPVQQPAPTPAPVVVVSEPVPETPPPAAVAASESSSTGSSSNDGSKSKTGILIVVLVLLICMVGAVLYINRNQHEDVHTDRAKVIMYLNNFDVEDVDLKHSATGGWHCSYTNALAQGHYEPKSPTSVHFGSTPSSVLRSPGLDDPLIAPLSSVGGSKISVSEREPLYLEEDDEAGLGGHDSYNPNGSGRWKSGRLSRESQGLV